MTERIVDFLDALVATVGAIDNRYCLVEKRQMSNNGQVTNIPYKYVGNGNYTPVEIDGGSVSYWRLVNNISFDVVDGNTAIKNLQATYPVRYVAMVKRDEVNPLTFSQDVANVLEGRNKDLQTQLQAKSVNVTVNSIDTDTPSIWSSEFDVPLSEPDYKRSLILIDMTVTVTAKRECWQSCDNYPDILQGFPWCEDTAATLDRLTEAQRTCLEDEICDECENAIVSNQTGDWEEDIPSGDTWPLPYGKVKDKDGNDVQVDYRPASEGYIFEETACPAGGGSISVAVSDASPSVGDTITITATPSDFTPDSYIFFAHNDTTNELTFIAEQASNTFDWEVLGVVGDNTVYVLGVENGSPDITAFGTVNITVASSYLIDLPYGSNINACFSFVRRSAAFNDYVAIIRRSSDNAQESFKLSSNDELDLTSENVSGTTTLGAWIGVDNGFLVTWKEQVSGITATNNIAASQAKIASAGSIITQNGVPAPTEVAWGAYTLSTPVLAESLFVIAKNDSISNAAQYPVGGNSSGIVFGGTVTEVTGISVVTTSGFYASHVEDVFIHLVSAIPSASLHIDGNLESAISLSPIVVRTIGTRPDNWGLAMKGKIMEVIFSSVAETVNRSDIESNINNSYSPSIF